MIRINYKEKMIITNDINFEDVVNEWYKSMPKIVGCPVILTDHTGGGISGKAMDGWLWVYNRYPIGIDRS